VKVGKNVFISHGAKLDWLAPWLITLEDGCVLGYEAMVVVHLYFKNKLVLRRVVVGQEAVVGLRASVCASMGPGSILSPGSVLLTEAPAGAVMSGNPAIEVNFSVRTTLDF
jgi:acetyltransferase-like isoleucine patch superfamily enzyme